MYMGSMECDIHEIVCSPKQTLMLKILSKKGASLGELIVEGAE